MGYTVPTVILIVLAASILWLMWHAWRNKNRTGQHFFQNDTRFAGAPLEEFHRLLYVATTHASHPLERVNVPGLQYRGYANVSLHPEGVVIQVTGEHPVCIPIAQISASTTAQFTIDKVVERDGLGVLRWQDHEVPLESTFRFPSPQQQQDFARSIEKLLRAQHT